MSIEDFVEKRKAYIIENDLPESEDYFKWATTKKYYTKCTNCFHYDQSTYQCSLHKTRLDPRIVEVGCADAEAIPF